MSGRALAAAPVGAATGVPLRRPNMRWHPPGASWTRRPPLLACLPPLSGSPFATSVGRRARERGDRPRRRPRLRSGSSAQQRRPGHPAADAPRDAGYGREHRDGRLAGEVSRALDVGVDQITEPRQSDASRERHPEPQHRHDFAARPRWPLRQARRLDHREPLGFLIRLQLLRGPPLASPSRGSRGSATARSRNPASGPGTPAQSRGPAEGVPPGSAASRPVGARATPTGPAFASSNCRASGR